MFHAARCLSFVVLVALAGPALAAEPLATAEGPDGVVFEILELKGDAKAVTLKGRLVNGGEKMFSAISAFNGETIEGSDPRFNPKSISGVYVIDKEAGKQAGPFFTTAGECLCTTTLGFIKPGSSVPVFAKFPPPPSGTDKLDVVMPSFLPVEDVPIEGGGDAGGDDNASKI